MVYRVNIMLINKALFMLKHCIHFIELTNQHEGVKKSNGRQYNASSISFTLEARWTRLQIVDAPCIHWERQDKPDGKLLMS